MILEQHIQYYKEIFALDGFFQSPFLMFGYQEMKSTTFLGKDFKSFLEKKGVIVTVLDYLDTRADLIHDMNKPIRAEHLFAYNTFCDIGCLEHVFDTRQCLKNCLDMVAIEGLYMLHTPVAGYVNHGLHTFNAGMLKWVVENNGFEIVYEQYSSKGGERLSKPQGDALLWLVAKRREVVDFKIPMQTRNDIIEA
ncbi:hypothetical protein LCGC14_2180140 [marine sediment metagenome]|uniref:Methyltransferase type 11 domain-containing protein n=1 Tax=marine sediment metagenome TaxID=412755 RepID=A0A0F9G025_9ZZZZ